MSIKKLLIISKSQKESWKRVYKIDIKISKNLSKIFKKQGREIWLEITKNGNTLAPYTRFDVFSVFSVGHIGQKSPVLAAHAKPAKTAKNGYSRDI